MKHRMILIPGNNKKQKIKIILYFMIMTTIHNNNIRYKIIEFTAF